MPKVKRMKSSRKVRIGRQSLNFQNPFYTTGAELPPLKTFTTGISGWVPSVELAEKQQKQLLDYGRQRAGIYTQEEREKLEAYKLAQMRSVMQLYTKLLHDQSVADEERQDVARMINKRKQEMQKLMKEYVQSRQNRGTAPDNRRRNLQRQIVQIINDLPTRALTNARIEGDLNQMATLLGNPDMTSKELRHEIQRILGYSERQIEETDAVLSDMRIGRRILHGDDYRDDRPRTETTPTNSGEGIRTREWIKRARYNDFRERMEPDPVAVDVNGQGVFDDSFKAKRLFQILKPAIGYTRPLEAPKPAIKEREERLNKRRELYRKGREAIYGVAPSSDEINTAMPEMAEPLSLKFILS